VPPRIHALFLLAVALIVTVFRRYVLRRRDGLPAFRAHYALDRLPAVTAEEREVMATFGRCIACGLCDRGEGARIAASGGAYPGVMSLVLAGSRSMPDFRASTAALAALPAAELLAKEALCPAEVPIARLLRFVREKAAAS